MPQTERVLPTVIEDEMKKSYIDYAMSVIVSRALPDARDGLKPVQRRILVAMNELGLAHNKGYRKSAKISGDVNGNYHPHGTSAIYDAMVRMAQEFSLRYPLVDGQGNFGSIDGDSAAAERYTEARMTRIAEDLLADIQKETVDFVPNYDETREEPVVLPAKLPNLLMNGASGIAVGMATNVPPHNLRELVAGVTRVIEEPGVPDEELLKIVTGPDFPTGGIIFGRGGIRDAYLTGRGRVVMRARANIETHANGAECIVITEIPFMVNKSNLIETIADLVRNGKVEGIRDIRDESDRDGIRIVIDLKRDAQASVILNQLYKRTQMQSTFGANMLALVDGVPRTLTLRQMIDHFIAHREEVIVRRTKFDLAKAEARAHILEGLKKALDHIDEIVQLIKKAKDPDQAKKRLMKNFKLSEVQAQAILDMRLQRLTGLQRKKIEDEYKETIKLIAYLKGVLESRTKVLGIIKEDLEEAAKNYGDDRRTEIVEATTDFSIEDLIAEEDMAISISHAGYIKRLPVGTYRRQARGGKGVTGMGTKEDDFVEHMMIASTHDYILFFTQTGQCHWLRVHEIPQVGRAAKGKAIVNLLQVQKGEYLRGFVPVREFDDEHYIVMASKNGIVKKTVLSAFSHPRRGGIRAMAIDDDDELIDAAMSDGTCDILLAKKGGKAIRFHENDVREMGRTARGVKGTVLEKDNEVVSMAVIVGEGGTILSVTSNGYGKRTKIRDYRVTRRGGKGVISIKTTKRNGPVVSVKVVNDTDEVMIMTRNGVMIRLPVSDISVIGRNTQGVRVINLGDGDHVTGVACVVSEE
ncbi:MAG: DNA gyrase subunit A [Candidatus Eisenbacteria bacterium]|nr:DNA gyrase subunit A [Candidatus Eisenbacteria bacterium]